MLCITIIGIDRTSSELSHTRIVFEDWLFCLYLSLVYISSFKLCLLHHPQQHIRQMGGLTCTRPLRPNGSRHLPTLQNKFKYRCPAITRRRCVSIKAFRSDSEGVMLPMDAYRVSGSDLHPHSSLKHASSVNSVRNNLKKRDEKLLKNFFLQVLGVSRAASRETCLKASEKLLGDVPDVGYTQVWTCRMRVLPLTAAYMPSGCTDSSLSFRVAYWHSEPLMLQEMLLSRALVLEATTNVLLDYTARRAYDRSFHIEVPYTQIPGMLFIP